MIKVSILGAGGRMGRSVIRALLNNDRLDLHGALGRPGSEVPGQDAGTLAGLQPLGIFVEADPARAVAGADVAIDFTLPDATLHNAEICEAAGCALVVGSTGHDEQQLAWLHAHSWATPVVLAPNMSVGVNLLYRLASLAAQVLPDYDAEIFEIHHRHKKDAPSGTALRLAEVVANARDQSLQDVVRFGRAPGDGPRVRGSIGVSAVRAGEVVGEHSLLLAGDGERLELRHVAQDRDCFARGALRAAEWVCGKSPGLYDMNDVLGLSQAAK